MSNLISQFITPLSCVNLTIPHNLHFSITYEFFFLLNFKATDFLSVNQSLFTGNIRHVALSWQNPHIQYSPIALLYSTLFSTYIVIFILGELQTIHIVAFLYCHILLPSYYRFWYWYQYVGQR